MVVSAQLRVRHRGCWTEALVDGARATHISNDREADFIVMHGRDAAQVDAFIALVHATDPKPPEIVSRLPTTVVFRGHSPPGGAISTIVDAGCSILWPAVYAEGHETFQVLAPSRERVEALVAALARIGEVRLEMLATVAPETLDVSVPLVALTTGLTERQLDVLRRAIENGYYEVPRETSAEALAKSFDLSRSTFEEHLRKAERLVLARFATVLATHAALSKGATRRTGRQPAGELRREGRA